MTKIVMTRTDRMLMAVFAQFLSFQRPKAIRPDMTAVIIPRIKMSIEGLIDVKVKKP